MAELTVCFHIDQDKTTKLETLGEKTRLTTELSTSIVIDHYFEMGSERFKYKKLILLVHHDAPPIGAEIAEASLFFDYSSLRMVVHLPASMLPLLEGSSAQRPLNFVAYVEDVDTQKSFSSRLTDFTLYSPRDINEWKSIFRSGSST